MTATQSLTNTISKPTRIFDIDECIRPFAAKKLNRPLKNNENFKKNNKGEEINEELVDQILIQSIISNKIKNSSVYDFDEEDQPIQSTNNIKKIKRSDLLKSFKQISKPKKIFSKKTGVFKKNILNSKIPKQNAVTSKVENNSDEYMETEKTLIEKQNENDNKNPELKLRKKSPIRKPLKRRMQNAVTSPLPVKQFIDSLSMVQIPDSSRPRRSTSLLATKILFSSEKQLNDQKCLESPSKISGALLKTDDTTDTQLVSPPKSPSSTPHSTFKVGDIVWAKLKGYSHWPARILSIEKTEREVEVEEEEEEEDTIQVEDKAEQLDLTVEWFSWKHSLSILDEKSVFPFVENFAQFHVPNKGASYKRAVNEARLAVGLLE